MSKYIPGVCFLLLLLLAGGAWAQTMNDGFTAKAEVHIVIDDYNAFLYSGDPHEATATVSISIVSTSGNLDPDNPPVWTVNLTGHGLSTSTVQFTYGGAYSTTVPIYLEGTLAPTILVYTADLMNVDESISHSEDSIKIFDISVDSSERSIRFVNRH